MTDVRSRMRKPLSRGIMARLGSYGRPSHLAREGSSAPQRAPGDRLPARARFFEKAGEFACEEAGRMERLHADHVPRPDPASLSLHSRIIVQLGAPRHLAEVPSFFR